MDETSPRAVCDCGRRHARVEIDGARVLGCPVCLNEGESAAAIRDLIKAVKKMAASGTPEGGERGK